MKKIYIILVLILACLTIEDINAAKVRVREKRIEKAAPADRFVFAYYRRSRRRSQPRRPDAERRLLRFS